MALTIWNLSQTNMKWMNQFIIYLIRSGFIFKEIYERL